MEPSAKSKEKKPYPKTSVQLQRMKLDKLMEKPHVPVDIPDPPRSKKFPDAPDFVRNVMGSSAGAGSGEFHVYRHIRRREQMRQKWIGDQAEQCEADVEYHRKLEENQRKADERTAKKRAKRLKKKQKMRTKKLKGKEGEYRNTTNSASDEASEYSDVEDNSELISEHKIIEPANTEPAEENSSKLDTKESDEEIKQLNSDNEETNGEQETHEKTEKDNDNGREDKS